MLAHREERPRAQSCVHFLFSFYETMDRVYHSATSSSFSWVFGLFVCLSVLGFFSETGFH